MDPQNEALELILSFEFPRAKRVAEEILVSLPPREAKGMFVNVYIKIIHSICQNLLLRTKREANEILINLQPRAKQKARGVLVNLPPREKQKAK